MKHSMKQVVDLWNVSAVINMFSMFNKASLFNQSLNSWDISSVTEMKYIFDDTISLDKNNVQWYDFK